MRLLRCRRYGNTPPQREVFGSCRKTEFVCFLAISIKDPFDQLRRIKASADLYPASRGAPCRFCANDGRPARRKRLLQRARQKAQIGKREILAIVGNNSVSQSSIEKRHDLVVAFASLGHCQVQATELLWHAYRGTNFKSAAGQMVQHADLFHHPGRMVVRQHHAHDAEPKFLCSRAKRGNQEVGRRGIGSAEMVLAEKYAFEAEHLIADPQIEIAPEQFRHVRSIWLDAWTA